MSEPRAVATGSGRTAKFISAWFALILFREVSVLIRGGCLIRSLPLAVLTHPLRPGWRKVNLEWAHARTLPFRSLVIP